MMVKRLPILVFVLLVNVSYARIDTLQYHVQGYAAMGTEGYAPHWITSNQWGIFNDSINDFLIIPGFKLPFTFGKKFRIETGLDVAIKYKIDQSFFFQAYANFSYGKLKLIFGKQKYTLGQYDLNLSSGSFLVSNNAEPIPRLGIGFYDYVDVPFTKGYLQIKAALNHGWLDTDRLHHSQLNNPYLHEKFLYIRTQRIPINPYIGFAHMALYGGEDKDGDKIPVDYKAVFLANGSSLTGFHSDAVNAVGEHLGTLDLGFYSRIKKYDIIFYFQKPITDNTGKTENFSRNEDYFGGISIKTTEKKIFSGFLYEFIDTRQQGGLGTPDPIVDGKFISLWKEEDIEFLEEYFSSRGHNISSINSESEWRAFLEANINYGYRFGGRVDFYNNYLYRHIYKNRIIGTPLFTTKPQLKKMTGYEDDGLYIVNNRIKAHHFGLNGFILNNLSYKVMFTYTKNEGAWQEYEGRFSWGGIAIDPDYEWFWKGNIIQYYSMVGFDYVPEKMNRWTFTLSLGYDFGDLDHNFGTMLGIAFRSSVVFNRE